MALDAVISSWPLFQAYWRRDHTPSTGSTPKCVRKIYPAAIQKTGSTSIVRKNYHAVIQERGAPHKQDQKITLAQTTGSHNRSGLSTSRDEPLPW